MKKPIGNHYTIIWIDVPDQPDRPPQRGTRARDGGGVALLRTLKTRLARYLPSHGPVSALPTLSP